MLGKLLKYEFKYTCRSMIPTYLALILLSAFSILTLKLEIVSNLYASIYILLIFAFFVVSIVLTALIVIQRYNNNLFGNEGYLSLTLPVSSHHHVLCKLISAMVWCFATGMVMLFSIMLIVLNTSGYNIWGFFMDGIRIIYEYITIGLALQFISTILLASASVILSIYFVITVSQIFSKNKVAISVLGFFLLSFIISKIEFFIQSNIFNITETQLNSISFLTSDMNTMINSTIGLKLIVCISLYFGTVYLLNKKINI